MRGPGYQGQVLKFSLSDGNLIFRLEQFSCADQVNEVSTRPQYNCDALTVLLLITLFSKRLMRILECIDSYSPRQSEAVVFIWVI